MDVSNRKIVALLFLLLGFWVFSDLSSVESHGSGHHCNHGHDHHHHHDHDHDHQTRKEEGLVGSKLPEELAEEEDMKLYGFGFHDHDHKLEHFGVLQLSGTGIALTFDGFGIWILGFVEFNWWTTLVFVLRCVIVF